MPAFLIVFANFILGAWSAFWAALISIAGVRLVLALAFSAAWAIAWLAMTAAIRALLPEPGGLALDGGTPLIDEMLLWFAFMKPAGLEAYIASVTTGYTAMLGFNTTSRILSIRAAA